MALDDTKTLAERILRLEQKLHRLEARKGRPSVELFDNSAIRNRKIIDDLLVHNHTHANLSGLDADDHTQYLNTTRHDVTDRHTLGTVVPHDSHSSLSNLSNDDHTQYLNETRHDTTARHTLGTVVPHDDHGSLSGLDDDDHSQYLNTTRHDVTSRHTLGTVVPHDDHGSLSGLTDDDHTQYTKHPASSTDNAIARWDGTDGDKLQNSVIKIDDNGKFSGDALDGWIYDTDTWTYVSATSFKVTGKDVRYRFPKGTKIKLVNDANTNYFYVVATAFSTDTTITITGGSDYSLAEAAISGQAYSYAAAPQDFPQWLNYTPVWSADGGTPVLGNGTLFGKFSMIGANIRYLGNLQLGSTTSVGTTTNWKFSLPISLVDDYRYLGQAFIRDLGTATYMRTINIEKNTDADNIVQFLQMDSDTNKTRISYNDPFAFGNRDIIAWDIWYAI